MPDHAAQLQLERLTRAGLWSYDIVADRLELSDGTRALLAPDDSVPVTLARALTLVAEPGRTHLRLALERAMIDGTPLDLEVALEPHPGRARRLRLTATAQIVKRRPARLDGCAIDIGERLRLEDENRGLREAVAAQRRTDALTGLPTLAALDRLLSERRQHGRRDALFYLDADRFKLVNDTCGHAEGDRMLRELAQLLRELLDPNDALLRVGSDEFIALVATPDPARLLHRANALVAAVAHHRFMADGYAYPLGICIGIALDDGDAASTEHLLSHASTACYVAKQRGGGRPHLYQRSDEGVTGAHRDMVAAARLEAALEQQRVELYGQRIVPLDGHAPPSYEVLIRLREPDGSIVTPGTLLGAAQRFGLMGHVERFVVQRLLERLHRLPAEAPRGWAHLSVNLSGSSIADPQFAEFLLTMLNRYPVPPDWLHFELTETSAVNEDEGARALIAELRERGHKLLLDDFGTGFTSFNYFKQLGVDGIKIDRSYTARLADDETNRAIVAALCGIGQRLGLTVIAEGVECESSLTLLREMGVRYIQGWLFHKAEPLEGLLRAPLRAEA